MIPLSDPKQQNLALIDEINQAMTSVAERGQYVLGPNVKAFEREVAEYLGCRYAVGVNSGTDALHLALRALDIGPGDEVITTPFTFIASTEAIGLVGATPVFVDIDPHTYNIDPRLIEPAISERTKAILPVHLYGQPCEMDAIMAIAQQRQLHVVEDCAQAIGAKHKGQPVGNFGVAGCFSFFPSKNLGCLGDGGMVVTNDREIYEHLDVLRRHGAKQKYHHDELGLNSRLDELQAAVLRIKLRHLNRWNGLRRECAYRYNQLFASLSNIQRPLELGSQAPVVPTTFDHSSDLVEAVYHQYTVLVDHRDAVHAALRSANVGCAIYYPIPLHLQAVHRDLRLRGGAFPVAERISQRCISLPMFPELTPQQQQQIVDCIHQATADEPMTRVA